MLAWGELAGLGGEARRVSRQPDSKVRERQVRVFLGLPLFSWQVVSCQWSVVSGQLAVVSYRAPSNSLRCSERLRGAGATGYWQLTADH